MICLFLCVGREWVLPITITFVNLCLHFFLLYVTHLKKKFNNLHRSLP